MSNGVISSKVRGMAEELSRTLAYPGAQTGLQTVKELFLDTVDGPPQSHGPLTPPLRIGAASGNDIALEKDAMVSRFHCAITRTPAGLLVTDENSTNGTYIDDVRVTQAFLTEGARLRVGETVLRLRWATTPRFVDVPVRTAFGELLGAGPAMRELFGMLERLAPSKAPVLVEGETGTGKELIARAIHAEGNNAQPFEIVDCGAIAPTLIESELFGHERGAFTGADQAQPGAFERANGGTIFLDEVGELPLASQPKLLRVLERSTIRRLGGQQERNIQVRVIAATHRDLRRMVNEGTFREDLYFRLAVCPVEVPALSKRVEDIGQLANHFFAQAFSSAMDEPAPSLSPDAIALLEARAWPGNVRELRNLIERVVILGEPPRVAAGDIAEDLRRLGSLSRAGAPTTLEATKQHAERAYLVRLLAKYPKDREAAAQEAGVHPKSLPRLFRRHGLRPKDDA